MWIRRQRAASLSWHVRDGQYVKQGTVLFEMRDGQDEPQVITASVAGTVTNLKVAVGMTSDQLAQQGPALQIADMNVLIGVVQTPEYVSVLLEAGQYVSITSTVTPGVRYQACSWASRRIPRRHL